MAFQNTSPTIVINPQLIGEPVQAPGGSPDALPTPTPGSICLELQSTTTGFVIPRMTTTQRTALTATAVNGMMVYDRTLDQFFLFQGGAWSAIDAASGTFVAALGSAAAPSYTFVGQLNTGMYSTGPNQVDFSGGGNLQFRINGNVANVVNYIEVAGNSSLSAPAIVLLGTDVNIDLEITPKGNGQLLLNQAGVVAFPTYSFLNDEDTGIWNSAANTLDFASNGGNQFEIQGFLNAVDFITVKGSTVGSPTMFPSGTTVDSEIIFQAKGGGHITIGPNVANTAPGILEIQNTSGANYTALSCAAAQASDLILQLPSASPNNAALPAGSATPMLVAGFNGTGGTAGTLLFSLNAVHFYSASISTANLVNMYTTGIQIIPSPGNGLMIQIHRVQFNGNFGVAALTGGGVIYLQYGSTGHGANDACATVSAAVLTTASSVTAAAYGTNTVASGYATVSTYNNAAISVTNATGLFVNPGTSTSTLDIYVWYTIIPTTSLT